MNNDLGFLIVFIVVPTVLVVSGIWLLVIVRSGIRFRPATSASAEDADSLIDAAGSDLSDQGGPGSHSDPVTSVSPDVADSSPEEFWTPLEETDSIAATDSDEEPDSLDLVEEHAGDQHTSEYAFVDDSDDASRPLGSATEPNNGGDSPDGSKQRRSASRMVPTSDNVARRTGQPIRRKPPIPRSGIGEKGSV